MARARQDELSVNGQPQHLYALFQLEHKSVDTDLFVKRLSESHAVPNLEEIDSCTEAWQMLNGGHFHCYSPRGKTMAFLVSHTRQRTEVMVERFGGDDRIIDDCSTVLRDVRRTLRSMKRRVGPIPLPWTGRWCRLENQVQVYHVSGYSVPVVGRRDGFWTDLGRRLKGALGPAVLTTMIFSVIAIVMDEEIAERAKFAVLSPSAIVVSQVLGAILHRNPIHWEVRG